MIHKPNSLIGAITQMILLSGSMAMSTAAIAEAVFDGTVGSNTAGLTLSGNFEIEQKDGAVAGNNLFHSFSGFGVNIGEAATFSHTSVGIEHIIARVTGEALSSINGGIRVRLANEGGFANTSADLWLINPNGIFIGDGAVLDPQSAFVFSTANRLGFSNGDNFYSHDLTSSSVLSVADPSSFGFLDRQDLPENVIPRGIVLTVQDLADTNTPLFVSNTTLIGSSTDLATPGVIILGDIDQPSEFGPTPTPLDSSQIQAFNLRMASLGAGGAVDIDQAAGNLLSTTADSPLSAISIVDSNILLSDNGVVPSSSFSILADHLIIENSFIDLFSAAVPSSLSIRAISEFQLFESTLRTNTFSATAAGDLRIDTQSYLQIGGQVSSGAVNQGTPTGNAGNIIFGGSASLPLNSFILQEGQIQSVGTADSDAGDIIIQASGNISLLGTQTNRSIVSSANDTLGNAGDIILVGDGIFSQFGELSSRGLNISGPSLVAVAAGTSGLTLEDTSIVSNPNELGAGAEIALSSASDISLRSLTQVSTITSGTNGNTDSGSIRIEAAGDLSVLGIFDISSGNLFSDNNMNGSGGDIILSGQNIELENSRAETSESQIRSITSSAGNGASIRISAVQNLSIRGKHDITSQSIGRGEAGGVFLSAADLKIVSPSTAINFSTSSLGTGDAGIVEFRAQDSISLSGVSVDSLAAEATAGTILLSSTTINVKDSMFSTSTTANNASNRPALISIAATQELAVNRSVLQNNTSGLSPAGQIQLTSGDSITLSNVSTQSGSLNNGASGSIFVASDNIEIMGADTELLTLSLGDSEAGDVTIQAKDTLSFGRGSVIQTSAEGSGNAGTISLSADQIVVTNGRIEGTSQNAGGGDVNISGREIRLDGDLDSGGIVFITTDSASSDADGNGGSITLGSPDSPAAQVIVRNSALLASANAGNGGRININADSFIRDARSVFLVTSTLGQQGSLEINSPEQDISAAVIELDVAILDATNLIQERCDVHPGDSSSLVIGGRDVVNEDYKGYLASPFETLSNTAVDDLSQVDLPLALIAAAGKTGTFGTICNYLLP